MGKIWLPTVVVCVVLGCVSSGVKAGTGLYMGPYFPSPQSRNITVHQDAVAYLPCTVKQLGDKSVSWVRQRDADILTVDRYTFVRDERLTVHYTQDTETWTLVIKYVQERDAGTYECQISTEPKMSMLVHLNVIVPQVEVIGAVDKYVRKGSTARLECTVSSTVQLPDYIFWYHSGERLLEYDHPRVKITVSRRGGQGSEMSVTSTLVITNAMTSDDGNYTCLPSNLHSATTILHVLNDEHPAAMQTGAAMLTDPPSPWGILLVVLLAFIFVHAHQDFPASSHKTTIQLQPSPSEYEFTFTQSNANSLQGGGGGQESPILEVDTKDLEIKKIRTISHRGGLVYTHSGEDHAGAFHLKGSSSRAARLLSWLVQARSYSSTGYCYRDYPSGLLPSELAREEAQVANGIGSFLLKIDFRDNPIRNIWQSFNPSQSLQINPVLKTCSCAYLLSSKGSIIPKVSASYKRY